MKRPIIGAANIVITAMSLSGRWEYGAEEKAKEQQDEDGSRLEHSGGGFLKKLIGPDELPKKLTFW